MKRTTTAMVIKVLGDCTEDYEVVKILETKENCDDPSEMFGFWEDQLRGSLKRDEMVMVETEYK